MCNCSKAIDPKDKTATGMSSEGFCPCRERILLFVYVGIGLLIAAGATWYWLRYRRLAAR